ncbi:MAG: hypothetical protein M1827_004460 [Pycnora praestabilis]|nr:MAG: hypothetical protein M1827_004460 [Pycnora praestabilis]
MPTRRVHTKTRKGCLQCKRRKTKCGEERPRCIKCIKHGATCSFNDEKSSLVVIDSTPYQSGRRHHIDTVEQSLKSDSLSNPTENELSGLESNDCSEYALTDLECDNLRLMNHYALIACETISDSPASLEVWRDHVPNLAFRHAYLLHGLLAVSALHLALTQPSSSKPLHAILAVRHHSVGLSLFRPHLTAITPANVGALFAFSCLTPLYLFGIHRTSTLPRDPLSEIHEVFTLIRGIAVVVTTGTQWLAQSPFGDSLLPQPSDSEAGLSVQVEATLSILATKILSSIGDASLRRTYVAALATLRDCFLLTAQRPGVKMTVVLFPIMVSPDFMKNLGEREPMALTIVAHYAVLLHWLRGHVWLEGWGKLVADAVTETIGREWCSCIAWVAQEVSVD